MRGSCSSVSSPSLERLIVSSIQQRGHRDERAPDDPIELAKRRYAKGEIGRDEYQRIRDDLAA